MALEIKRYIKNRLQGSRIEVEVIGNQYVVVIHWKGYALMRHYMTHKGLEYTLASMTDALSNLERLVANRCTCHITKEKLQSLK